MKKKRIITKEEAKAVQNEVKQYIYSRGLNYETVAKLISQKYPNSSSDQNNLSHKVNSGTIKYVEMKELADILNYDIKWVSRS
ncbi:MAG: LLM class flavin-dependent oxidoreductase [bacterium]|nr:LLM class flavin-dependent oxidoreductase [bacterium]